jgi:DNA-binding transcriptional MerR regulator/methylmalonyl-CoA mutase cobalamin-binding subunit
MSYHEPRHSMSVVTRRTGLTSHAVRVWEKRYNAVSPGRTGTNRRLYSDADIDRLRLLHAVTLAGHSIGTVAHAGNEQLEQLLKDAAHLKPLLRTVESPSGVEEGGLRDALFARACAAIEGFEDVALEQVLREANAVFSRPILLDQLLTPLLEWLGQGWQSGRLRVAHEHFSSALIRNFLITLRSSYGPQESAPVLVVATPVGQHHEIGALIVAEIAASEGWHVVYMGPGLPAEDIGLIARARHAAAIALSIVYPTDDPQLARDLRELDRRYLPADTALIVGGSGAAGYRAVLEETGAQVVTDMESLRRVLAAAREQRARNVLSSI